jgi:type 1 glutamine amidotransferase
MHVDPAVEVLATTRFPTVRWYHSTNKAFDMPVTWTKRWGHGRVFYTSLGHHADIFDIPEALEMVRRGFVWAARGKDLAVEKGLSADDFKSDKKMF